jgi:hypothetical protein
MAREEKSKNSTYLLLAIIFLLCGLNVLAAIFLILWVID